MKNLFKKVLAATTYVVFTVILPSYAAVPIGCDEDVSASISTLGEIDEYTFFGQAGERIIIRMKGAGFSLDAKIELYDPSESLVAQNASTNGGLARIGNPTFQLPATGTYTIRASDNGNNDAGTYGRLVAGSKAVVKTVVYLP